MKASVVFLGVAMISSGVLGQTPGQTGNTIGNIAPTISNTVNSSPNAASSSQGGAATANPTTTSTANPTTTSTANPTSTARGGTAMANPAASSGATANPSASSGSSAVTISTGNTTFPSGQSIMTVPMVYTPSVATGNVCALGASGGASWLGAGFAFGASWESMQCERRQTAALLWNMNTAESKAAAKEILCNSPEIREAYARIGAPCTIDLMRVAGSALPQQRPTIAPQPPQPVSAPFDATPYAKASDCLTAAQAAGAPLSVCAGEEVAMTYPAHFTLEEFLVSGTARSLGVSNYPTWEIVDNLRRLGDTMERIRAGLGGHPVTISSGYRCPEVNAAVGGVADSAHLYGLACDFVVPAYGTPADVCSAIQPHLVVLEIDQLIYEVDWVHMGLCAPPATPRCECFRIG